MVASVRRIITKSDRSMAVVVLEDLSGRVDLVLFPEAFERHSEHVKEGAILDVRGRLERRGETLQIVGESVSPDLPARELDDVEPEEIVIRFQSGADSWSEIKSMQQVDEILRRHEGINPVVIEVPMFSGLLRQLKSRTRRADWSIILENELLAVHGVTAVELMSTQPARLAS
jgi:DNA polymerase-3 subunit alpha